jgi:hypothetical protein
VHIYIYWNLGLEVPVHLILVFVDNVVFISTRATFFEVGRGKQRFLVEIRILFLGCLGVGVAGLSPPHLKGHFILVVGLRVGLDSHNLGQ